MGSFLLLRNVQKLSQPIVKALFLPQHLFYSFKSLVHDCQLLSAVVCLFWLVVYAKILCQDDVGVFLTESEASKPRDQEHVLRDHLCPLIVACLHSTIVDLLKTVAQNCNQQVKHDYHRDCY